jgi:hypothetical protein
MRTRAGAVQRKAAHIGYRDDDARPARLAAVRRRSETASDSRKRDWPLRMLSGAPGAIREAASSRCAAESDVPPIRTTNLYVARAVRGTQAHVGSSDTGARAPLRARYPGCADTGCQLRQPDPSHAFTLGARGKRLLATPPSAGSDGGQPRAVGRPCTDGGRSLDRLYCHGRQRGLWLADRADWRVAGTFVLGGERTGASFWPPARTGGNIWPGCSNFSCLASFTGARRPCKP